VKKNTLYVAEISANHLGDFERAKNLVRAAIDSGANAVKFQTYTAETMTLNLNSGDFRISDNHPLWGGQSLYSLYESAHTPWEWHSELFDICRQAGVIAFSSPFDLTAVDFLESIDTQMYKISSMETSDLRLIERVSWTGKPTIISTGATTLEEIDEAVATFRSTGNNNLTLLVCTSSYPAEPKDANLWRIGFLRDRYQVKVGISDHTLGVGVGLAALALGAEVIEKHFTLSRMDAGPDGAFSMEPSEFKTLVEEGESVRVSIGSGSWQLAEAELESRRIRRSLYITEDVKQGEIITESNVRAIRPGMGMSAGKYSEVLGKRFAGDYKKGTPLNHSMLAN